MDMSTERQLCLLIEKMDPEHRGRLLRNPKYGPIIFQHTRYCVAAHCKVVLMEILQMARIIPWRFDARPRDEHWKLVLMYQAELSVISERGS
jgi:hypothetical protein